MSAPKDGTNRIPYSRVPLDLIGQMWAEAMAEGDTKYYPDSWREGFLVSTTMNQLLSHYRAFMFDCEDYDKDAEENFQIQKHHLSAMLWAVVAVYNSLKIDPERFDDRWKKMQKQRQQEYKERQAKAEESELKNVVENYIDSVGLNI